MVANVSDLVIYNVTLRHKSHLFLQTIHVTQYEGKYKCAPVILIIII